MMRPKTPGQFKKPLTNATTMVALHNIRITYQGGGSLAQTQIKVPEHIAKYPEAKMFGELPAFGFYCSHVDGLKIFNVQVLFETDDMRHGLVCDDVSGLEIDSFSADCAQNAESVLVFNQVRYALLRGCMASAGTNIFLKISGKSREISLIGNDFSRAKKVLEIGPKVDKNGIIMLTNRHP